MIFCYSFFSCQGSAKGFCINLSSALLHVATLEYIKWDQTYFGVSSFGAAFVIFEANLGFASCCVRDGREMYGLSCCDALHS